MNEEVKQNQEEAPNQAPLPPGLSLTLDLNYLRNKKLFVATPMYGGQNAGLFNRSMLDLSAICAAHGIQLAVHYLFNESLITRARNYCVDEFMRQGGTHLLFIDSDIGFNPKDVLALMQLQTDESPYDVIGGAYPKKCISWEKIKHAVDKGVADEDPQILNRFVGDYVFNPKNKTQFSVFEPVEVLELGTGFMMIRRATLEAFAKRYQKYLYRPDHIRTDAFDGTRLITMFFQAEIDDVDRGEMYDIGLKKIKSNTSLVSANDVFEEINKLREYIENESSKRTKRYLSEDYWFCQKIQELGMSVWLCPWMALSHVGTYIFDGSLADLASIGAPATASPEMLNKFKKKK